MRICLVSLVIIFILGCEQLYCQQKHLFLISGKGMPASLMRPAPVQLLKLEHDSLRVLIDFVEISSDEDNFEFPVKIGVYHKFNKAVIYKTHSIKNLTTFYILDFSQTFKLDTIIRNNPDSTSSGFAFYAIEINGTPYVINDYYPNYFGKNMCEGMYYQGINLINLHDTAFKENNIVKYLHSEGEQGIALCESCDVNYSEIMRLYTMIKDGSIINQVKYPRLKTDDTATFSIPEFEQYVRQDPTGKIAFSSPDTYLPLQVVNKDYIIYRSDFVIDTLNGQQKFAFFDGDTRQWHETPFFKGFSLAGLKHFGSWLAGYVSFEYQWGYEQRMKKYGGIPGKEFRNQENEYGYSFDERINMFKQFPEGVLYLYNMRTSKYFEWEALEDGRRQGDSEILLVEDEVIYYRINDKIYKRTILNGKTLGEAVLLVQDSRIPDSHWLFLVNE